MSDIPTITDLVELMHEGKLDPEGYLDILEKRLEEDPEAISSDDLWDLYRGGRLSEEEYLSHPLSWDDNPEDLPEEVESLDEVYRRKLSGADYDGRIEFDS